MCPLDELAPGTARRFEIDGVAVAVVRIGDDVYAIGDVCSHANVSLSDGEVWCDERELECPKHGSTFDLITGEPVTLPATQPVPVFDASVVDGDIVVSITSRCPRCGGPVTTLAITGTASGRRRQGDPARHRPRGVVGRGARRDGPQRCRQEHVGGDRGWQARLRGARGLGHARWPRSARDAGLGARGRRAAPRDAVPDRGAGRDARRRDGRGAAISRTATRPTSKRCCATRPS